MAVSNPADLEHRRLPTPLLKLVVLALAIAIFLFDTFSPLGIAVAVLYAIVILLSLSFTNRTELIIIAVVCACLAVISYLVGHLTDRTHAPLLRCIVSICAIVVTTLLALKTQHSTRILEASERRYRHIFQSTAVSIWEEEMTRLEAFVAHLRREGVSDFRHYFKEHPEALLHCISLIKVVDVNDTAIRLLEAGDAPDFPGSLDKAFLPETMASFESFILAFIEGKQNFSTETVIQSYKGKKLSILMFASFPSADTPHDNVLVSITDITEARRIDNALQQTRAELAHAARVATLGELTASIAHEVGQPLTAVVTNADACIRWLDRPEPDFVEARACLDQIVIQGRRAADVVQSIRALSKKAPPRPAATDIAKSITNVVKLLERELNERGGKIETQIAAHLPNAIADQVQIQQVLINIVMNGIQAMQDSENSLIVVTAEKTDNDQIHISVRDEGIGVSEDELGNLFTAFYSTKSDGLGMGLSICKSIIESHDGRIWATRNDGPGTTFHVTLPIALEGAINAR